MSKQKRIIIGVFFILSLILLVTLGSLGQESTSLQDKETITLNIGLDQPYTSAPCFIVFAEWLAPRVSERVSAETNYEINWVEHWGTIAKAGQSLQAVQNGLLDIAMIYPAWVPAELFPHNFGYFVPFDSPDPNVSVASYKYAWEKVPFLSENLEEYNQKLIAVAASDGYNILTTFPVNTLDDFEGRKIAAAGCFEAVVSTVGCSSVNLIGSEAYTSLQTGVYEGVLLPSCVMESFKLYEVAEYYTEIDFGSNPQVIMTINRDTYDSLPKEVSKIIDEVAEEYMTVVGDYISKYFYEKVMTMKEAEGVISSVLPKEERDEWIKRLKDLPSEFVAESKRRGEPGADIINAYLEGLEQNGYTFPTEFELE